MPTPNAEGRPLFIDTHCHLDMSAYRDDLDEVLQRAEDVGVRAIVSVGIDVASSKRAVALAEKYDRIYATVGIHPHDAAKINDQDYEELKFLATHPKVVAYGEIGLDMVKQYAPAADQLHHFERQVDLAKELGLPLVIHDREAHEKVISVLRQSAPFPAGGVMHCFSGDLRLAEQSLELGFYVSVPGIVTFAKAETLQEVAANVPLDYLLLETDGPYLAPHPKRGKRNEPAYLVHTAAKIAELRSISLPSLAEATVANACRLFRLPALMNDC